MKTIITYLHLQEATSIPDPDLELSKEDDIEQDFVTWVKEGGKGLTQVEENEKGLEQQELRSSGLVKKMGSLSTEVLSREDPISKGKIRSTLMTSPDQWENRPSCNGCHGEYMWMISGVREKREEAQANPNSPLISPSWYTGPHGYRLRTHLYLHGNGTQAGSHISIFLSVVKGEFDHILSWPLKGKMSFILLDLNQKLLPIVRSLHTNPNSLAFQQPPSHSVMNLASGCPEFARLSVLDDERYVKDDKICIKCSMKINI